MKKERRFKKAFKKFKKCLEPFYKKGLIGSIIRIYGDIYYREGEELLGLVETETTTKNFFQFAMDEIGFVPYMAEEHALFSTEKEAELGHAIDKFIKDMKSKVNISAWCQIRTVDNMNNWKWDNLHKIEIISEGVHYIAGIVYDDNTEDGKVEIKKMYAVEIKDDPYESERRKFKVERKVPVLTVEQKAKTILMIVQDKNAIGYLNDIECTLNEKGSVHFNVLNAFKMTAERFSKKYSKDTDIEAWKLALGEHFGREERPAQVEETDKIGIFKILSDKVSAPEEEELEKEVIAEENAEKKIVEYDPELIYTAGIL